MARAVVALMLVVATLIVPGGVVEAATAPVVSALSPSSGPATGGTTVTIVGSGFTGATRVTFGTRALPFTVIDDATITATTPRRPIGNVSVRVTTPDGR